MTQAPIATSSTTAAAAPASPRISFVNPVLLSRPKQLFELLEHTFTSTMTLALLGWLRFEHPTLWTRLLVWHFRHAVMQVTANGKKDTPLYAVVDPNCDYVNGMPLATSDDEAYRLAVEHLNLVNRLELETQEQRFASSWALAGLAGYREDSPPGRSAANLHMLTDLLREDEIMVARALLKNDQTLLKTMHYQGKPIQPVTRIKVKQSLLHRFVNHLLPRSVAHVQSFSATLIA